MAGSHRPQALNRDGMAAHDRDAGVRIQQVARHRLRASIQARGGWGRSLIGADECCVVDPDGIEETFRPLPRLDRLQNHGLAVATDGYRAGRKAELFR